MGRSAGGGGSGGGFSGGGFGGFHIPTFIPIPMATRGGGGGGSHRGSGGGGNGGCGCAGLIVTAILVIVLLGVLSAVGSCMVCSPGVATVASSPIASSSSSSSVPVSTVERTKLPTGDDGVDEGYFTDVDGDWIKNSSKLEAGLKQFFKDTGVRPYVYILPNGQTTSVSELGQMAARLYDELFDDENHFLLVFCDNGAGGYNCGYAMGSSVKTVMDDEAIQILGDYLDRYYNDMSLSEEEIFSKAFADTGARIMTVQKSPVPWIVGGIAVVAVAGVVVFVVKKRADNKEAERKHKEAVLNTPLETFGDASLDELEKKYGSSGSSAEDLAKKYNGK